MKGQNAHSVFQNYILSVYITHLPCSRIWLAIAATLLCLNPCSRLRSCKTLIATIFCHHSSPSHVHKPRLPCIRVLPKHRHYVAYVLTLVTDYYHTKPPSSSSSAVAIWYKFWEIYVFIYHHAFNLFLCAPLVNKHGFIAQLGCQTSAPKE